MSRDLFIIQRCRINFLIAIFMIFGASAVNSCDAWMSGVHPNTINGIPYFNGSWFRHCQQKGVKKKKEKPIFPFIICGQSLMRAFSCEICSHKHIWYTSFRLLQAYHKQTIKACKRKCKLAKLNAKKSKQWPAKRQMEMGNDSQTGAHVSKMQQNQVFTYETGDVWVFALFKIWLFKRYSNASTNDV